MGYWATDPEGHSFVTKGADVKMIWGDAPADVMDEALAKIVKIFQEDVGRKPTMEELIAGVRFAGGGLDDEDDHKGPLERRMEADPGYVERLEAENDPGVPGRYQKLPI